MFTKLRIIRNAYWAWYQHVIIIYVVFDSFWSSTASVPVHFLCINKSLQNILLLHSKRQSFRFGTILIQLLATNTNSVWTDLTIFYKKGTGLNEKSWMEPYHISDQWYMSRLVINPEPWCQTQTYIHTTQPSTYASDSSTSMWLHSSFHNLTDEHETSWTVRVGNNMCLPFCFPLASFIYRMLLRCWGSLDIPPFMLWNMTNGIMHRTLERVHMHKCRADN